jgi:hypothetical protein
MAHAAPGTVRHLAILKVVARPRKQVVVAGMVVMEVADDDVGDLFGIDVDRSQSFGNRFDDGAPALGRHSRIEAGVHDKGAVRPFDHPDEVGERLVGVVRIAADVVFVLRSIVMRVTDGVDFVDIRQ